ncbi:BTAD domain-containing putative transcriptional regulator [Micromonospora andamanensis]|uniref:OmpR/PhoB-type domain-containing protein n=1 Tax=Micromonospora andamanensis TaxID=1287068 RepID=A0ABQ4I202_9ACTN|nr:AfsR/SARP family transcriptional regulator [Micromonospora andamanensis]GIJ11928.1 hypothetical protein Van01_51420 [Micromonospora andamanensis]
MRYLVLGPVATMRDGWMRSIPSEKVRTLLAALLLHPNEQMSVTQLTDRVWNGDAPASPRRALQTNVVRLRRELPWNDSVVTTPAGYLMRVEPDDLDLTVFRRLLDEAAATTDLEREAELLRRALQLWRGPACADVPSGVIQEYDVLALTERRLRAVERRLEVDLLVDHFDGLVAELRALTAEFPLRERFWALLMAALHRQGRQAEALETYHTVSHRLADGLGIDPGVDLRKIHQEILTGRGQHELLSPRTTVTVHGPPTVPSSLPTDDPQFAGRDRELAAIDEFVRDVDSGAPAAPRTVVIDGPAGMGKSALALRWSTLNAHRFPDGHLYVDLAGFGPTAPLEPVDALGLLLQSLGTPVEQIPDSSLARAAMFRLRTSGLRMLVVLDNAASSDQVRALLPGASCLTIVTSRNQLRGLATRHAVRRVTVPRLSPGDACALIGAVVGGRIDPGSQEVRRLVELCDRTPLALRIVAEKVARLPHVSLPHLLRDLIEDEERLEAPADFDANLVNFRTVLSWSTRSLDAQSLILLRRLATDAGEEFSLTAAAELAAVPPTVVRSPLDRLVAINLLGQEGQYRYRLSPLVRAVAVGLTTSSASLSVPVTRLVGTAMALKAV